MAISHFIMSNKFLNTILANNFGIPTDEYTNTKIYFGLGIEFDEDTFTFSKEPVAKGFTILPAPIEFTEPANGIIRNKNAIAWPKAEQNWTTGAEQIQYIGLYYKLNNEIELESDSNIYELIGVLPLTPAETVKINERMVLNANTVQIKLSNR